MIVLGDTSNFRTFRPALQNQNLQLQSIVDKINARVQQKRQAFDVVDISKMARELQSSKPEDEEKIISYDGSPLNGSKTEAEWAESALTSQRNGINTIKDIFVKEKERLQHILSKIDEYEKIANGTTPPESGTMTAQRAAELAKKYRASIRTDFSSDIENMRELYSSWATRYDENSNGLASTIMQNPLQDISQSSIGYDPTLTDPDDILKAMDSAINRLEEMTASVEKRFLAASGKTMQARISSNPDRRKEQLALESLLIEAPTIGPDIRLTGQRLQL